MTPTREQFKEFMAFIKNAQEKEDNLDKAFELKEFWSKLPLERSRIVAERLRKRMEDHHVTEKQLVKYTRMDANRLHQIMAGEIVMNVSDYCDIYFAILNGRFYKIDKIG